MKTFKVEIKEVLSRVIEVEAVDLESAKEKVSCSYHNEDIVLDYEDLTEASIKEYKEVNKVYRCIKDLQDTDFALGLELDIDNWNELATGWAESDQNDSLVKALRKVYDYNKDNVIDFISEIWDLEFEEVK